MSTSQLPSDAGIRGCGLTTNISSFLERTESSWAINFHLTVELAVERGSGWLSGGSIHGPLSHCKALYVMRCVSDFDNFLNCRHHILGGQGEEPLPPRGYIYWVNAC
jgi:hypothetical protein